MNSAIFIVYIAGIFCTMLLLERHDKRLGRQDDDEIDIYLTVMFAWPVALLVVILRATVKAAIAFAWAVFRPQTDPIEQAIRRSREPDRKRTKEQENRSD